MTDPLARYPHRDVIQTRWSDNDMYGHVNNVLYYSYLDTVIARWLMSAGGLDLYTSDVIGLCVESSCRFTAPLAFPADIDAGLAVTHLGRSSVHYEVALRQLGQDALAGTGRFVHVFVDRTTRRPVPLPDPLRIALTGSVRRTVGGASVL